MKNHIKTLALATLVLAVVAGIGTAAVLNPKQGAVKAAVVSPALVASEFSYAGAEGKTALDLLTVKATSETKGEGVNAYVTTINGRTADNAKNEFWAFYVNDKQAAVGAGSYITKSGDKIRWVIETF